MNNYNNGQSSNEESNKPSALIIGLIISNVLMVGLYLFIFKYLAFRVNNDQSLAHNYDGVFVFSYILIPLIPNIIGGFITAVLNKTNAKGIGCTLGYIIIAIAILLIVIMALSPSPGSELFGYLVIAVIVIILVPVGTALGALLAKLIFKLK